MILKSSKTKVAILRALYGSPDRLISSKDLIKGSGVSRQAIWKAVESLREEGFSIESIPHKGYYISGQLSYDLAPTWIALNMNDTGPVERYIYVLDSVDSTQTMAKDLARRLCKEGTVVISEEQTSGRGRLDRTWNSPAGNNLYMSVITYPRMEPSMLHLINLAAGLAVVSSIREVCHLDCTLKWPNDVLFEERKICGILSEASIESDRIHFVCVGMGLNINQHISEFPAELREKAGSIIASTGKPADRGILAANIVSDLHYWINQLEVHGPDPILTSYRQICSTLGHRIQITTGNRQYQGTAVDITSRGEIEVETEGQRLVFSAGDIIHSPHLG